MKRRPELQGMRTVAIIGVILYHIWPNTFSNGFLGVDIFFVISGHLMAHCLANLRTGKFRDRLLNFYARRTKRILPVYLAVICGTVSVARTLMLDSDFNKARSDMYWALGFASNLQGAFERNDYFAEVFSYRPFLHCWSLGVEVHFYALAPWAMFGLLAIPPGPFRFALCSLVLLSSVAFQQFLLSSGHHSALAFGLLFCRFWQFFAGILVFFFNVEEEDGQENSSQGHNAAPTIWPFVLGQNKATGLDIASSPSPCTAPSSTHHPPPPPSFSSPSSAVFLFHPSPTTSSDLPPPSTTISSSSSSSSSPSSLICLPSLRRSSILRLVLSHILLFSLLATLLAPISGPLLPPPALSTLAVLLTSTLLHVYHCPGPGWTPSPLLTNLLAVQLGDLSYVWYLVHWPTIVFIKYFFTVDYFSPKYGLFTLLLTLLLALLVDRFLDANIRRLPDFCSVSFLIGLLYVFCFFLILPTFYSGQIERISTTKDYDGSLGARTMTLDTNFTKMIINDLQKPESGQRLASTLSLYEKIRMNELMQSATFEDRYKVLRGEERLEEWTRELKAMVPDKGTPRNLFKYVIERRVKGNGTGTMVLVGNSHADVISRELAEEMRSQYNIFHMFTLPGCIPIAVPEHLIPFDPALVIPCPLYTQIVKKMVERTKPAVLFMAFRWYPDLGKVPFDEKSKDKDELLSAFRHELHTFKKSVRRRIFISAPSLLFKHDVARELAKRLWQRTPLDDLHMSAKDHFARNHFSYARLQHLDCPKCTVFDISDHFCDQKLDKCWAFDEQTQLANFFDNNHLSYLGRQAIRPYLRGLIGKM